MCFMKNILCNICFKKKIFLVYESVKKGLWLYYIIFFFLKVNWYIFNIIIIKIKRFKL